MKKFMLMALQGEAKQKTSMTAEERAAAGQIMGAWMKKLQENDQLVSSGAPLASDGRRIGQDGVVTDLSTIEMKELVTGYMIIKATDLEEATKIALESPMAQAQQIRLDVREIIQMG